jgi:hypothetical protein
MTRRRPLLDTDIRARERYATLCPRDRKFWRDLLFPRGIESSDDQRFIDTCADEIDRYRLSLLVAKQERAETLEAERQVIGHWERLEKSLTKYPASVRRDVTQWLSLSEPHRLQIEYARRQSKARQGRVLGHRAPAITPALVRHASALQRIACDFNSSLVVNWKALRRWLEKVLIKASKEGVPGKNAKARYFACLMLPRTAEGGVDLQPRNKVQMPTEITRTEVEIELEEKLAGKRI